MYMYMYVVRDRVAYKAWQFDTYKCLRGEEYLQPRTNDRQGVWWAYMYNETSNKKHFMKNVKECRDVNRQKYQNKVGMLSSHITHTLDP